MKKNLVFCAAVCFILLLSSCNFYTYQVVSGGQISNLSKPENIKIYSGDIEQQYEVIAAVTADVVGGGNDAQLYLRNKASKLGADAIIHVKLSKADTFTSRTSISGVAVRFR